MSGSRTTYVISFTRSGLTEARNTLPASTPGTRPTTMVATRRTARGADRQFMARTYRLIPTSTRTSAGLRIRLVVTSSAMGTVMDEKP
jgi:hypothetical protein